MDKTSIQTLIFDLGEVVIDVDSQKTESAFLKLSNSGEQNFFSFAKQSNTFNLFEKGLISADQFRSEVKSLLGTLNLSDIDIDLAWNAMLGEIPNKKKDILLSLKNSFQVFALSNTNDIHIQHINHQLKERNFQLEDLFHQAFYSFKIAKRKPDADSFQHVLEASGTPPQYTLMIDDRIENLETAKSLGMQTLHLKHPDDFYRYFTANGQLILL